MLKLTAFLNFSLFPLFFLIGCITDENTNPDRPNIIFILADDMGYGDPGCYNPASAIPTPNIDRLAAEGIRFTNAHAPGSWCVPSRYGLLTGQYPLRADLTLQSKQSLIAADQPTIASILRDNGYFTGCIGKWHLGFTDFQQSDYVAPLKGGPVDHGFNEFFGIHASLDIPPYFFIQQDRIVEAPTDSIRANYTEGTTPIQGAFWRAGKIAKSFVHKEVLPTFIKKSVQFLEQQRNNQPFFLYLAFSGPHTPWLPAEAVTGKSQAGLYGDFVVQIDQAVGEIIQKLEDLKISQNTLIFVTSDNGPVWYPQDEDRYGHESNGFLRGMKTDLLEGGHRVPFIARWPGHITPGTVSDEVICFTDMLATFTSLVKDTLPSWYTDDSYNILPVLLSQPYSKPLHAETIIMDRVIIQEKWKLILGSGYGNLHFRYSNLPQPADSDVEVEGELYQIRTDPGEMNNLYTKHPEVAQRLRNRLQSFKQYGRTRPRQ
jgi:arylsulfatase A-like enzyme